MRHLRHIVLAAVAIALCAPAVASAHGAQLLPSAVRVDGITGGDAQGQAWYRGYTLPADQNPGFGNSAPCVRVGDTGNVLLALEYQPGPCTISRRTAVLVWGISYSCDNASQVVDPASYGADYAAQIRCALKGLRDVASISVTIDGAHVDLHRPRYLGCSRQRRVQIRPDNWMGYEPGPATMTACGYTAWLTNLAPGRHVIRAETSWLDESEPYVLGLVVDVRGDR